MASIVRHLRRSVQKIAQKAGLSSEEAVLVADCVVGICKTGSCKVSDIVRVLNHRVPFRVEAIQIEATDYEHRNIPLWQETYSTEHPEYKNLYDSVGRAALKVLAHIGMDATWLFDRGFDGNEFYTILKGIGIDWVIRQMGTRNVVIGNDRVILMSELAASLDKPHEVQVPYVDKESHKVNFRLIHAQRTWL
ncbi:MAG: hypothetical protein GY847_23190 [Proteobacteria bacterium]|nr:hypothetical protein [Pseudomonadota bacterium]